MNYELFLALSGFAIVSSITPGPNNLMLMASGANFGFRRSIPHMLGIALGFCLMVALVGLGLAQIFEAFPASYLALKTVSVLYLIYLAYKIANAGKPEARADPTSKPFTFLQAAMFQWVNPKAWSMALTATTVYAPSQSISAIGLVALIFGVINLPSVSLWAVLGLQLQHFLTSPRRLKLFNYSMAALLLASLYPVLIQG
ncbi:MAG: LysE family translocator [Pseudohongiellaceae bacterium]